MVVAAALGAAVLWRAIAPSEAPDTEAVAAAAVESAVRAELGNDAVLTTEFSRQAEGWSLQCGTISGPEGAGVEALSETARERLNDSADFCALVETSGQPVLRELDMGSTDMPAMDWMEKYALPPELLTDG